MFQMVTSGIVAIGFLNKFLEASGYGEELTAVNPNYLIFGVMPNIALVLTSLYFISSVRHTKTE